MDETVGDGAGGGGVVEQRSPVFESQVGGDDGGGALVALVEDLVEQVERLAEAAGEADLIR